MSIIVTRDDLRDDAEATPASAALLMLAGLVKGNSETVWHLWGAPCVTSGPHPLDDCDSLGAALVAVLSRRELRLRLDYVEVSHGVPDFVFAWRDGDRSVFAPYDRREWRSRVVVTAVFDQTNIKRLLGSRFEEIAKALAA